MELYKYQGAGNDFLIADNLDGHISVNDGVLSDGSLSVRIEDICDRRYGVGADGLMLLERSREHDFTMAYFNSDGSGGMMCGNGGRCIVAFAADRGLRHYDFGAADGFHTAEILASDGHTRTVRLKMKDVGGIEVYGDLSAGGQGRQAGDGCDAMPRLNGCFLDTGTRHFVTFTDNVADCDVVGDGRKIRYMPEFGPVGTNVNFVEQDGFSLKVRTYEKGVEDETYACGTGIVASSIAAYCRLFSGKAPFSYRDGMQGVLADGGRVSFGIRAVRDRLSVDFIPGNTDGLSKTAETGRFSVRSGTCSSVAEDVWLTGPATFVAKIVF